MVFEQYISNGYLRAGIIFIGLLLILRISASILERIILKLVRKTKTELDDIIIKKSSVPITIILFFLSLRLALNELTFAENIAGILYKFIHSVISIMFGYLIYIFVDIIVFELWKKFSRKAKIGVGESLGNIIHSILKVVLVVLIGLYILNLWGVNVGPLLAGLGIAGLAIALALQPALANIFSGGSIILDKSVRVGDLVIIGDTTRGTIVKVGLRSTRIKTFDNELVIIPNTLLANSKIQNIVLPEPKVRVVAPFSVAYGSDISKVKKIVMKEIKSVKHICKDPEPFVRFLEMANSSLNFKAYFHVESYENRYAAMDEANTKIYNALNKNKIIIPFPQMDVHLKKK